MMENDVIFHGYILSKFDKPPPWKEMRTKTAFLLISKVKSFKFDFGTQVQSSLPIWQLIEFVIENVVSNLRQGTE